MFEHWRGDPVGVRNCDHALDLRIRSGRVRRASASLDAREASFRHFDSLAREPNGLTACGAIPDRT
jgi:hypothetical protein